MSNQTAITYDHGTQEIAFMVINPIASYIALATSVVIITVIIMLRLVITVDAKKSDLLLFNINPPKHLDMLLGRPSDNKNAQHNKNAAILAGLMVPPPPNGNDTIIRQNGGKGVNGLVHSNTNNDLGEIIEPARRSKKSKF